MKEFFEKYKKLVIIILIVLLFLGVLTGVYFLFLKDSELFHLGDGENVSSDDISMVDDDPVTPLEDFDEKSSKEAILATSVAAKAWASDAKLYDCTGMTSSSYEYSDVTYYYVGGDSGNYAKWLCTYYSKDKGEILIYKYNEGEVEGNDSMEIGEYGYMTYDSVSYPTDLEGIVDSTVIYAKALEEGMDDEVNYVNMYLGDTMDYGYVWKIEERDKEEVDEYGIGVLVNTYIFDTTGNLKTIAQEDIY